MFSLFLLLNERTELCVCDGTDCVDVCGQDFVSFADLPSKLSALPASQIVSIKLHGTPSNQLVIDDVFHTLIPNTYEIQSADTTLQCITVKISGTQSYSLYSKSVMLNNVNVQLIKSTNDLKDSVKIYFTDLSLTQSVISSTGIKLKVQQTLTVDTVEAYSAISQYLDDVSHLELKSDIQTIQINDDVLLLGSVSVNLDDVASTTITLSAQQFTLDSIKALSKQLSLYFPSISDITFTQSICGQSLSFLTIKHDSSITVRSYDETTKIPSFTVSPKEDVTFIPEKVIVDISNICLTYGTATCEGTGQVISFTPGQDMTYLIVDNVQNDIDIEIAKCTASPHFDLANIENKKVFIHGAGKLSYVKLSFPVQKVTSEVTLKNLRVKDSDRAFFDKLTLDHVYGEIETINCNEFTSDLHEGLEVEKVTATGKVIINDLEGNLRKIKFDVKKVEIEGNEPELDISTDDVLTIVTSRTGKVTIKADDDCRTINHKVDLTFTGSSANLFIDESFSKISDPAMITISYSSDASMVIDTPLPKVPEFDIPESQSNPPTMHTNLKENSKLLSTIIAVICLIVAVAAVVAIMLVIRKKRSMTVVDDPEKYEKLQDL